MLIAYKGETFLLSVTVLDLEERPKTDVTSATVSVYSYSATNDKVNMLVDAVMNFDGDGLCTYRWDVPAEPEYTEAVVEYVITDSMGYVSNVHEAIKFEDPITVVGVQSGLSPIEREWLRLAYERTHYLQYDIHGHVKSTEQHPEINALSTQQNNWLQVIFEKTYKLQYDDHNHVKSSEQHPVFTPADRDKLDHMADRVEYLVNLEGGRWRIDRHTGQMIFYGEDNTTELARFLLKDKFGNTVIDAGQAYERIKL